MMAFVIVLHVIACLMLIIFILLQAGKGHGLAGSSFGSEMNTVFGTRTAQFMTKVTSVCAILFLLTCLGIDILIARGSKSLLDQDIQKGLTPEQMEKVMAKLKEMQDEGAGSAGDVAGAADTAQGVAEEAADTVAAAQQDATAGLDAIVEKAEGQVTEASTAVQEGAADAASSAGSAVEQAVVAAENTAANVADAATAAEQQ